MYQALYRKYRPRIFSDVTGQEHITQTLREQIRSGRLSHAYLFVGTRGTGKTTCAKILSRVVNCENPVDGDACNKCASCIGIENGSILDVLELDAASNNGVDSIRSLREEAIYTPGLVKKRIYIIDEVHMLTMPAFNALLKILEEPPEHLIFILATTELHKVPATIMSRCQRFMFRRISPEAISKRLDKIASLEEITLTEEASKKLSYLADGSMRDAISLFDQCAVSSTVDINKVLDTLGLVGQSEVLRIADTTADRDITGALSIFDDLYKNGRDMLSLLNEIGLISRDILVFKLSENSPIISAGSDKQQLKALSEKYTTQRLLYNLELIREAVFSLSRGGAIRLTTEMCLIRMCDESLSNEISALASRIAKLEEYIIGKEEYIIRNGESGIRNDEAIHTMNNDESKIRNVELVSSILYEEYPDHDAFRNNSPPSNPRLYEEELNKKLSSDEAIQSINNEESGNKIDEAIYIPEIQPSAINQAPKNFWADILNELQNEPSAHAVLNKKDRIWAEEFENHIVIFATDQFTVEVITRNTILNPLKEAAKKVLGREVEVRVELKLKNNKSSADNLDHLRTFGNVRFE